MQHTHSGGPGLGWLLERGWQLDRLSCRLGAVEAELRPEVEAALLRTLEQGQGRPSAARAARPSRSSSSGGETQALAQRLLPREVSRASAQ